MQNIALMFEEKSDSEIFLAIRSENVVTKKRTFSDLFLADGLLEYSSS